MYAPADDDVVAFEPMTAPTNALVAGGPDLPLLEPGGRYEAIFTITVTALEPGAASCETRHPMRVAVVGHVEWVEFVRVEHVPAPGEIVHALESWEEPGGGGAVAAVQLARLAGGCLFLTALGDDALGRRAESELEALGVRVEAACVLSRNDGLSSTSMLMPSARSR